MVIREEETRFSPDETKIKDQLVFLEKSKKPSSYFGDGIPHGIILLTNKRLFFYCTGIGGIENKKFSIMQIAASLSTMIIPGADKFYELGSKVADYGIGKYLEHHNTDIQLSLNNESSFIVPLNRIRSCEKFGNYYVPNYGFWKFSKQNKYTRIGIRNASGTECFYCIYCTSPINPKEADSAIRYDKWYDEIFKLLSYKSNITCHNCNIINNIAYKFCTNCGSSLNS